jgi:hypothetical protein
MKCFPGKEFLVRIDNYLIKSQNTCKDIIVKNNIIVCKVKFKVFYIKINLVFISLNSSISYGLASKKAIFIFLLIILGVLLNQ